MPTHAEASLHLQMGLQLLMADGNVFKCYDHIHLTMFYSELGASKAILDAGYTIDCLMIRWVQGCRVLGWMLQRLLRWLQALSGLPMCVSCAPVNAHAVGLWWSRSLVELAVSTAAVRLTGHGSR